MSVARPIPEDTRRNQADASDPRHSVWVSANAGSGKTHVLAQRVIRLLLDEVEPSKILCLTYTKAAAANMGSRVFRELADWTGLDDASLGDAIAAIEGSRPDAATLKLARQLFARALETPGGLKIQTIHAFCEAVLHQFPLEANIAGHFELLDRQMEAALVAEARRDMLTGASGGDDPELAEAFAVVFDHGGEFGLETLLGEIVRRRDELRAFIEMLGAAPYDDLFAEFDLTPADAGRDPVDAVWPDSYFDARLARAIGDAAAKAGKAKAADFALDLAAACKAEPKERFAALRAAFLKKGKAEPRGTGGLMAKGVGHLFPDFEAEFARFAAALCDACERQALAAMLQATSAALTVADRLIARYERLKSARGFLDFNDLITRTIRLLSRSDASAWVQYKLDRGIDHILVDEAQDTSPDQWRMIRKLAEEFFAGRGSGENRSRTLFAVGDEKQSIYSFQGAQPQEFALSGREFAERIAAAEKSFKAVKLQRSFRSTDDVLAAVDLVFLNPEVRRGLSVFDEPIEHKAIRAGEPGYVEVWPSLGATGVEEPDDWEEAIDHASAPAVRLAGQIAATIAGWIASGERIEGTGKRLTAGDVIVLVRKRDRFVNALSAALKERHVEVAGADRLHLASHIAVRDLVALGRVVLQPDDDLSLAALLRSPVFALTDEDLFAVAHGRGGLSLYAALRGRAEGSQPLAAIVASLEGWRNEAGFRPAFEFYAGILGRDGVRRKLLARLGRETGEILDEFLNFCLAEERIGSPGLESLIETLESAGPEIKREMDQSRDEVRIMTVHAAKGLEAPVVFLVDSGSAPFSHAHLPRLMPFDLQGEHWPDRRIKGWLWRCSTDVANAASRRIADTIGEKAKEEYRRLLYVGMTRAGDRLIVCGYHGQRTPDPMTWHSMAGAALAAAPEIEVQPHPAGGDAVHRFRVTKGPGPLPKTGEAAMVRAALAMPAHWRDAVPPAEPLPRPLSPSGAGALIDKAGDFALAGGSPVLDAEAQTPIAVRRGIAVHRLLQMLPGLDPARQEAAALAWLARAGADWPKGEPERVWREVASVLNDRQFAPVFATGSRAEVAVTGRLGVRGAERAVSGTIDRLGVSETEVLIVDYKTTRPAPVSLSEAPSGHLAQLALYRALLQPLYPGRAVSAALLYTGAPRLIAVPAFALDEALAQIVGAETGLP